jgi:large subunit ribosomal protein L6
MSRIGKKPIRCPGVKYTVEGNTVLVEGPKGKVTRADPGGITLREGRRSLVERENDKQARFHGLPARWSSTP